MKGEIGGSPRVIFTRDKGRPRGLIDNRNFTGLAPAGPLLPLPFSLARFVSRRARARGFRIPMPNGAGEIYLDSLSLFLSDRHPLSETQITLAEIGSATLFATIDGRKSAAALHIARREPVGPLKSYHHKLINRQ